jgi:hypothetical protein
VDVQTVHLEILDLELPHDCAADSKSSNRQSTDGTGPDGRRADCDRAEPGGADLSRSNRPSWLRRCLRCVKASAAAAESGRSARRPTAGLHSWSPLARHP